MVCVGEVVRWVGCGGSLTVEVRKLNAASAFHSRVQFYRIPSETDSESEGPFAAESAMTEELSQG